MNDMTKDDGPPDDRVPALLRRAGVVEEPPPPHVWEAIARTVRGPRRHGHHGRHGVSDLRERRRSAAGRTRTGWPALLAAAAVGALLTWAGLAAADRPSDGLVLASGPLAPLVAAAPAGDAEVVEVDGQPRLRVTLEEAPEAGDGYLEVWLLRPDVSGMVTLGVLEGDSGEFLLPPGLDLGEYPVVDISLERVDGDPTHGGASVVRGEVG